MKKFHFRFCGFASIGISAVMMFLMTAYDLYPEKWVSGIILVAVVLINWLMEASVKRRSSLKGRNTLKMLLRLLSVLSLVAGILGFSGTVGMTWLVPALLPLTGLVWLRMSRSEQIPV